MSILSRAALVALVCAGSSPLLAAEQTGEIRGSIIDQTDAVLPQVLVTARSPSLQGQRTTLSDPSGFFRLPLLPVGTYALTFERDGFETLELAQNEVHLGYTATLSVTMTVAGITEDITISPESPLIDVTSADTSYRLSGEELRRIPSQDRTIAEVVAFAPGVTGVRANTMTGSDKGLPSFRGEGDAGNNWLVDGLSMKGVETNDPGVRINYDAWDEVQVISDGFAPELGQALGGFVNVVTKSGGNEYQGALGALIRPGGLRAERQEQLSAASLPETSIQNYFGNLGGPILKDRLWFFVSDNVFSNSDTTSEQSVGWLTIPGGERRTTTNNIFGKVTYSPGNNHTLSASGALDKLLDESGGIGVPETYATTSYENSSYRLNYRGILSPMLFLTAAAGHNRRSNSSGPLSGDYGSPSYFWQDIAQRTNNVESATISSERRSDLALSVNWMLSSPGIGRHEIKAGLSHYWNESRNTYNFPGYEGDPWREDGFDDGVMITWADPGTPLSLAEYRTGHSDDSTRGLGLYLQDSAVLGRLSLMVGLRADTQQVFNDVGTKLWSWGLGDFLQPRLSLAYDLTGDQRTFLKLAYGRFAMPIATQYLTWFNSEWAFNFRQYEWTGPANPTEGELRDPSLWQFMWEQSASATPYTLDPGLKPNSVHRVLVALERQLGESWGLKLRGIRSQTGDLTEDIAVYVPESPAGLSYLFTNFEEKRRDYWALEAEVNARMAGRLLLDASYTWSRARGATPGNSFEAGIWGVNWGGAYDGSPFGEHPDLPADHPDKEFYDFIFGGLGGRGIGDEGWYGDLPYSVDHDVKVLATYLAPYDFRISASFEWLSGYHWEKKGWSTAAGFYLTFPEGRGGRTTPAHTYLDLVVDKEIRLRKGLVLDLGVNVYNVFNSQRPVSYVKEDTELFEQVWGRQLPRWAQIRVGLRF